MNTHTIILAAGKGTRMNTNLPKVMQPLGGMSLIEHVISTAQEISKKITVVIGHQKNLLKEYINNISNTNSLREFVNDEVQNIKTTLESHVPNISDDITRIKLQEAVNQIENLTKGRIVKDKQVISLMRYYELIKELDNVRSK